MLPFLKDKEVGTVAIPDKIERKPDEAKDDEPGSLSIAMSELHSALNAKDYKSAADIFRSAFDLLESEPHEEVGPIS